MLDKDNLQRKIAVSVGGSLLVAGVLLFSLLIWRASKFVGNDIMQTVRLELGPIKLVELGRQQIDGQTAAVVHYQIGLLWYFLFFLVSGVLIGLSQSRK